MTVRKTESRIPLGFNAFELGESVQVDNFALVCYLRSPVPVDSKLDYVLFVTAVPEADRDNWTYSWKTVRVSTGEVIKEQKVTHRGVFDVTPNFLGEIATSVEIMHNGTAVATSRPLLLRQEVVSLEPTLEVLFESKNLLNHLGVDKCVGTLGGTREASRELINGFRQYVFEAIGPAAPRPALDVPLQLLAATVYMSILETPKEGLFERDHDIEAAAAELNDEWSVAFAAQIDNALGVSSIAPQTLAMVLERPGTGKPYTPWLEKPSTDVGRAEVNESIRRNLMDDLQDIPGQTAEEARIDLFNLLRFPKSNIRMCALVLRRLLERDHRKCGSTGKFFTSEQLLESTYPLQILATEYNMGATQSPLSPEVGPRASGEAKPNSFGRAVVDTAMKVPAIALHFADSASDGALAYGGYDLRRDDNDARHRWGGFELVGPPSPEANLACVKELQTDLSELEFKIVGTPDGDFGRRTEWAVREFQIYAKMPYLAREDARGTGNYLDRLSQTVNVLPYTGPISGVANIATRVAIQYWKAERWRCPVIVGAWNAAGTIVNSSHQNIWRHDEMTLRAPRVYARDLSRYYALPHGRNESDKIVVGEFTTTPQGNGPVSLCPRHTWRETEVRSKLMIGIDGEENLASAKQRSTFKVIRAVAEVECMGYLDTVNAYDKAIISVGLFHWTIGRPADDNAMEKDGELCGLLAFLAYHNPEAYDHVLRNFGVAVNTRWGSTGQDLLKKDYRKYSAWISLQNSDGSYSETPRVMADADYFRTWHWFYRFLMATRTSEGFQRAMWGYARIRIRDILSIPWGVPSDQDERVTANGKIVEDGAERDLTIGDVHTSEKALALLLRAHVLLPNPTVIENGKVGRQVRAALKSAKAANNALNWSQAPSAWGDSEEQLLIEKLLEKLKGAFASQGHKDSIQNVHDYPTWTAANNPRGYQIDPDTIDPGHPTLRDTRGSFRFDKLDLPLAPDYGKQAQ